MKGLILSALLTLIIPAFAVASDPNIGSRDGAISGALGAGCSNCDLSPTYSGRLLVEIRDPLDFNANIEGRNSPIKKQVQDTVD